MTQGATAGSGTDLAPKQRAGDYQLIAQLGRGGMADVYLARLAGNSGFAKLAVVKRKRLQEDDEPDLLRMFADEGRLSALLNHPNIVQTFEVGEDDRGPFLVMEYLEGQSLGRLRARTRRNEKTIPRGIILNIICETLAGLQYAHTATDHNGVPLRIVHRDVSPENIMITYDGQTKLVDFGVAKTAISETRAGVLKGKVLYMAPEQARTVRDLDLRTDIFAVGVVLWEFLSGKRFWHDMSDVDVFTRLLDDDPLPRIEEVIDDVPPDLAAVCNRALAKDRSERFSSAAEMLEALEASCKAEATLRLSNREVGSFVASLFTSERQQVRAVISGATKAQEQVPALTFERDAESSSDDGTLPIDRAGGSGPSGVVRSPDDRLTPPPSTGGSDVESGSISGQASAARRRRRGGLALGGTIATVVLAAVAVGFVSHRNSAGDVRSPSATFATAVDVNIEVGATPSFARIFIDGQPAETNPYRSRVLRADARHVVRVEADGYEPQRVELAYDRDRTVNLALAPLATANPAVPKSNSPPMTPPIAFRRPAAAPPAQRPSAVPPPAPVTNSQSSQITEMSPDKVPAKPLDTDVFKR